MQIIAFITKFCPLKCEYCVIDLFKSEDKNADYWLDIFEKLDKKFHADVCISGGDPFTFKGIEKLLPRYHSDMLALNPVELRNLIKQNGAKSIALSLDSIKDNHYDKWSKIKSDATLKALPLLEGLDVVKIIGIVVSDRNYREIPEMIRTIGDQYTKMKFLINLEHNPEPVWKKEYEWLADQLISLYEEGYGVDHPNVFKAWKGENRLCIPLNNISVEHNGTLRMCFLRKGHYIAKYKVEDLLDDNKINKIRSDHWKDISEVCKVGCKFSCVLTQDMIAEGKIPRENWW